MEHVATLKSGRLFLRRLLPSTVGAVLVISLIWGAIAYHLHQTRREDLAQARRNVTNMSIALAEQAARLFEGVDQILRLMQEDYAHDPSHFDLKAWSQRATSLTSVANQIALFDGKGDFIASSQSRPLGHAANISARPSFRYLSTHPEAGLYIGQTHPGYMIDRLVLPLGRRLVDGAGTFVGAIYISLDPERLTQEFKTLDVGADGTVALFGVDGVTRARSPSVEGMYTFDIRSMGPRRDIFRRLEAGGMGVYQLPSGYDDKVRIYAYRKVVGLPLVISLGLSMDEVLAPYRTELGHAVSFGALSTAAVILFLILQLRNQQRREMHNWVLTTSELRYRLVADNATDMITHMDLEGRRSFVSPASLDLLGYAPDDLVGTSPHDMVHPDDAPGLAKIFADFAAGRRDSVVNVNRLRHKDGGWVWIEASLKLLRDKLGTPWGVTGVMRNITERRHAETALQASETRFRLLAENTSELIILAKSDGTRTYISPASQRLFGYAPDELATEMELHRWVHPDERDQLSKATLGESGTTSVVCRVTHKDGGWVWVECIIRRFTGTGGDEPSIIATFRDISERQAQDEALRQAKLAAEQASQAKTEFLAAMSHEIRTPLNAVLGYADLLLTDRSIVGDKRISLERIQNAGSALRTVVDDILDFSKIEAGKIELAQKPFRPGALVYNAVSIVRGSAQAKAIDLVVDIGASVPNQVVADHDRLRQVLLNLLNNAIKFTLTGSVTLSIRALASQDGRAKLRFGVEDTGIGIPKEKLGLLFQRFSQIDGSISRDFGGTGLGLAICRRLIEAMDGTVGVCSEVGRGSTFWFDVTLAVAAAEANVADAVETGGDGRPMRVLLVEDQELNRDLAVSVLRTAGHIVDSVDNGVAAIDAVLTTPYDVVLMDIQMPTMDGIEATRRIRRLDHPSRRVPIVAMTAMVLPAQVAELEAAGMTGHVGKPFRREELLAAVARHRAAPAAGPAAGVEACAETLDMAAFRELVPIMGFDKLHRMVSDAFAEVSALVQINDRTTCAAGAHAMLSAVGTLGFTDLSTSLRTLESACLSQAPTASAAAATAEALVRARRAFDRLQTDRALSFAA